MKKILVLILIGLITLSIYSVFMNFFSSWQYNQQVQALQNDYSTDDSINLKNLSSHQIPSPLRDYLAFSNFNGSNLPIYVRLKCSGSFRSDQYSSFDQFSSKSFYSLKDGYFVSERFISRNRIIFSKIRETLSEENTLYQEKLMGVKEEVGGYGGDVEAYLISRIIIEAAYFPHYLVSSKNIQLNYISPKRIELIRKLSGEELKFSLEFNEDSSLKSISSSTFKFLGDRVNYKAEFSSYINKGGFMVPANIRVVCEENFSEFTLYESRLDEIQYR